MAFSQHTSGVIDVCVSVLLPPVYLRIIYIFLSKRHYRKLECYRLMVQIGLFQLTVCPALFFGGLVHMLDYDHWNLGSHFKKLGSAGLRADAALSFALALNRLKIICALEYSQKWHTALLVLIYVYVPVSFTITVLPQCAYYLAPGVHSTAMNSSLACSVILAQISSIQILTSHCLSLVVYVIIVGFLIHVRHVHTRSSSFANEMRILLTAGVRFVLDVMAYSTWKFIPKTPIVDYAVGYIFSINAMIVPPVIYLLLNNQLRSEFMSVCVQEGHTHSLESNSRKLVPLRRIGATKVVQMNNSSA